MSKSSSVGLVVPNFAQLRVYERKRVELKVEYSTANSFFVDYARNISKGGTFIRTDNPLPVGAELKFMISIPHQVDPIPMRGVVRWSVSLAEAAKPEDAGMGIEFVFVSEEAKTKFHAVVENLMTDSLGEPIARKLMGPR